MFAALIGVAGVLLGVALGASFRELQRRRDTRERVRGIARELEPAVSRYVSGVGHVLREEQKTPYARTVERRLREFASDRNSALAGWGVHRADFAKVLPSDQWSTLSHGIAKLEELTPEHVASSLRAIMEPDLPPPKDAPPPLIVPLVGESMGQTVATILFFTSMMSLYDGAVLLARLADSGRLQQLESLQAENQQIWDRFQGGPYD